MKNKITLILSALLMSITSLMAQSPNMFNYQGVARDSFGNPLANQSISLRFQIHTGALNGSVQYSETRTTTTAQSGLFNVQIGSSGATNVIGSFDAITWSAGTKYLQVEMDPAGGSSFTDMGTQQLVSVPYAQHAKKADALTLPYNGKDSTNGNSFTVTNTYLNSSAGAIYAESKGGHAISGKSANKIGVWGATTSNIYSGVFGFNYNSTGTGVQGKSNNGTGVFGESIGSGNGVKGTVVGPTGNGVYGVADPVGCIGVYGTSNDGVGVKAYSNGGTGVFGSVLTGTALKGFSYSGYGLEVIGKMKVSGGNTNPGKGKVLTSDSLGNATWEGAVAFSTSIPASPSIATSTYTTVVFNSEKYDLSNNFNTSTYRFTAPVKGIYHFDCQLGWQSATNATFTGEFNLNRINNGNTYNFGSTSVKVVSDIKGYSSLSKDVMLEAGDIVYIQAYQSSGSTKYLFGDTYFTGRLVVKL